LGKPRAVAQIGYSPANIDGDRTMPWIDVSRRFTWKPRPGVMQDVEPHPWPQNVTRACAERGIALGAAKRAKAPRRDEVQP
jgi:hypothetical protein